MYPYLSGKRWWVGVIAIALFTLLFFQALQPKPSVMPSTPAHPAPQKQVAAPAKQAPVPTHPILELFNPSDETISRDQAKSKIHEELEQLLVIAIMLQRCDIVSESEYTGIYQASYRYAQRTRLFTDVDALMPELLLSAQKTYQLVYAGTSCQESSLRTLKEQTMAWQAQYNTIPQPSPDQ
jgi:hypothetical protein